MANKSRRVPRRVESLSRDRIIDASIELLGRVGAGGLTFRALSEKLATGPGAIYWHVDNKSDLLTAACDAVVARSLDDCAASATPAAAAIRSLALALFDAIDAHPWVGSALTLAPGQSPMLRILERIGQQVRALDVPSAQQWQTASALLNYILGVGGQNAANGQLARTQGLVRADMLESVAAAWSQLDASMYPFVRSVATQLPAHDDRQDFLAGVDLLLRGIAATHDSCSSTENG